MQQCCFDRRVLVCKTSVCLFVRTCELETVQIDNAVSHFFDWLLRVHFDANLSSRSFFEKKDIRSLPNFFNQKGIKSFATLLAAAIKLLLRCSLMPEVQKTNNPTIKIYILAFCFKYGTIVFFWSESVTKILGGTGCHIPIWSLINVEQDSRGSHFAPI